jgi:hypothetical protein
MSWRTSAKAPVCGRETIRTRIVPEFPVGNIRLYILTTNLFSALPTKSTAS